MRVDRRRSGIPASLSLLSVLLICTLLTASGCTRPSLVALTNYQRTYPKTEADSVRITTEQKISTPYTEVGYVYVQAPTLEDAVKESRKKAAQSGGHMIIDTRAGVRVTQVGSFLFIPMYDTAFYLRGMVIRYIQ
ncbi:MAG: hypothetical protein OEM41_05765 [Ignavibacteria bacterium]|nr:hypothetical protein [Ignavibacteria bacterium]